MKIISRKTALILMLCLGFVTAFARGGSSDFNNTQSGANEVKSNNGTNTSPTQTYVHNDLRSFHGKNAPASKSYGGRTYYKINRDVNAGTNEKPIYLYYATTTDKTQALGGIIVKSWVRVDPSYTSDSWYSPAYGTARDFDGTWRDLNKGNNLSSCVKLLGHKSQNTGIAITKINVFTSSNPIWMSTWTDSQGTWTFYPKDLNDNDGDIFIYLLTQAVPY